MKELLSGMRHYGAVVAVISSTVCSAAFAQTDFDEYLRGHNRQFEEYKASKVKEYEVYRNRINKEYSDFMRAKWETFTVSPEIPIPLFSDPIEPPIVDPEEPRTEEPLPFSQIKSVPESPVPAVPLLPYVEPDKPTAPMKPSLPEMTPGRDSEPSSNPNDISFNFYGCKYKVPFSPELRFSLPDVKENTVADAWSMLSKDESVELIETCINLRNELGLSDWGYLRLLQNFSKEVYPRSANEATLLQMFILAQSGYKVRPARRGEKLMLLIPNRELLYSYLYTTIGGENYYIIDDDKSTGDVQLYNKSFPNEQSFTLELQQMPRLGYSAGSERQFCSNTGDNICATVCVNTNLIDFFNDYPLSSYWDIYANASLSDEVKSQLYPTLRTAITGKSKSEAANILLHFTQKAFKYKTDGEQFGYERPFFADETFAYPYSDCEDRAILYSVLVRDLLDLPVVLVHYQGHLATAVMFDEDVAGDYFALDGGRYVVCDPTYINADIGMAMPMYKSASAELLRLK